MATTAASARRTGAAGGGCGIGCGSGRDGWHADASVTATSATSKRVPLDNVVIELHGVKAISVRPQRRTEQRGASAARRKHAVSGRDAVALEQRERVGTVERLVLEQSGRKRIERVTMARQDHACLLV